MRSLHNQITCHVRRFIFCNVSVEFVAFSFAYMWAWNCASVGLWGSYSCRFLTLKICSDAFGFFHLHANRYVLIKALGLRMWVCHLIIVSVLSGFAGGMIHPLALVFCMLWKPWDHHLLFSATDSFLQILVEVRQARTKWKQPYNASMDFIVNWVNLLLTITGSLIL